MRKEGDAAFPQQVVERLDAASRRARSVRENDVDGGTTTLVSPSFDVSTLPEPYVSYARWYSNDQGSNDDDTFTVDVSSDGGASSIWLGSTRMPRRTVSTAWK